eukprot:snap_masked-scaffold903_size83255-processed-gene-0.7 protein:Tk01746 transcript:snap_masked-scaffold903_size83255-processed-gene-0.7-mRNA-1 annotation:"isoform o"
MRASLAPSGLGRQAGPFFANHATHFSSNIMAFQGSSLIPSASFWVSILFLLVILMDSVRPLERSKYPRSLERSKYPRQRHNRGRHIIPGVPPPPSSRHHPLPHHQSQPQVSPNGPTKSIKEAVKNYRREEKKILDNILDTTVYDNRLRPQGVNTSDGPTVVNVNLYVRSFEKIDDVKMVSAERLLGLVMEYSVQITFRQQWNDHRLAFNDMSGRIKYLTLQDSRKVWMPDTFFRNEKHGQFHNIIQPNLYIRVFPNGDILYSIRVSLTLSCPMTLELFPLDTQTCYLRVASYGFTTDDLVYLWKVPDPVQFVSNLFLPGGFELHSYLDGSCNVKTATGEYSCLTVDMTFKRQISYYIITIYIPTLMIVMVSWMSFWLDHKSAPARVSLTITTLLAMSTTTSSINNSLPPVAYTKAIDVWSNLCVTFVFLALLEYALVNYAARADARANAERMALEKQMERDRQEAQFMYEEEEQQYYNQREKPMYNRDPLMRRIAGSAVIRGENKLLCAELPRDRAGQFKDQNGRAVNVVVNSVMNSLSGRVACEAKRIDVISRIIFPLSFAGFNIMYWSYYLTMSYYSTFTK